MRTNIVIDDELMDRALQCSGLRTKKEAVHRGLELLVQLKQQEQLREVRGRVRWSGDQQPDSEKS